MDTQQTDTDTDEFDEAFNEAVAPPSDEKELPALGAATEGDAKDSGTDSAAVGTDASGEATGGTTPAAGEAIEGGAPAASEDAAEPEPFKLSAEQTALLKTFDDEWPEVAKASALRTQMAVQTAVGALMGQLRKELAPIVTHYAKTAGDSHLGTIRVAHNDFDTLKPKVLEWIGKQPTGIRNAYTAVAKEGSAEDVIELVNIYKKVNGLGTPAAVAESADASVTTTKQPAPEVKKAADSLAVIPGRRSVVPKGGVDKNDFDGGWREATGS